MQRGGRLRSLLCGRASTERLREDGRCANGCCHCFGRYERGNMKKQARDDLEEMFEELGELGEVRALTRKKLLADTLRRAMKAQRMTPAEMARRMKTSRPTVYRLLDPGEPGATLDTLERASLALGLDLQIRLVPQSRPKRASSTSPKKRAA